MKRAQGSFGSRNGAAWGQVDAGRRADRDRDRTQRVAASLTEAVIAPSQQAMREAIGADVCPFCGAGPYKNLGMHTNRTHGVSAAELREMSGLKRVCSDELSDGSRDRLIARPDFEEITKRATLASMESGSQAIAAAASLEKRNEAAAVRDPEIIALAAREVPRHEIAARLGVGPDTVSRVLDKHGVPMPMQQTNAERRQRLVDARAAARAARNAATEAERNRRLERFRVLGGDWPATQVLAAECGVSTKAMTAYLKDSGVALPDGRTATSLRRNNYAKGVPNAACRAMTEEQIRQARDLAQAGLSQKAIAAQFGVGQATISRVLRGSYVDDATKIR